MVFLSPLALLGLAAALVPPLLHLFQRRQPADLEFPAVRYVEESARAARRAIRLRHLILLLLRVSAVVLVVLAAARPVVPGSFAGVHEPTALVIVLDNSLSSGAVQGGHRVLDDLAARARETLRDTKDGDALWLVTADGLARRGTAEELSAAVTALAPISSRLELGDAVRSAQRLAAGARYARAEVHLLSDLQRSAWDTSSERARGDVPVLAWHPAHEPPPNIGVVTARAVPPVWLAGAPGAGVRASVGGSPADRGAPVPLALTIGGRAVARGLAVPGGGVVLAAGRVTPGWLTGEVTAEPDEMAADDRRPFAVRVLAPAAVQSAGAADVGPFVAEALGALEAAGQVRLNGGDVVIGTSVPPCATRSRGCTAVILPPADPSLTGALDRALAAAGVPWSFGARVASEDTVAAPDVPELAGARVLARRRLVATPADSGDVLARVAGEPWIVRHDAIVLVGSRLVADETTLPLGGRFVPFVGALVNRVVRGERGVLEASPGAPFVVPGRVTAMASRDTVLPAEAGPMGAPLATGVWALRAGLDTVAMLVVAPDRRESDLTPADAAFVRGALAGASVTVTDDPRAYAARRFRGVDRSELTGTLLALALVVLIAEGLFAAAGARRSA